jgi:hypothetical protein
MQAACGVPTLCQPCVRHSELASLRVYSTFGKLIVRCPIRSMDGSYCGEPRKRARGESVIRRPTLPRVGTYSGNEWVHPPLPYPCQGMGLLRDFHGLVSARVRTAPAAAAGSVAAAASVATPRIVRASPAVAALVVVASLPVALGASSLLLASPMLLPLRPPFAFRALCSMGSSWFDVGLLCHRRMKSSCLHDIREGGADGTQVVFLELLLRRV